ncbi:MFS general substrate transporter [Jaminaea rosea]|uniref:MFS general substrate transporter n=1 Tax=Jaminaea rosea TaxID=1569628 RepID=A0A316UYC0_9BASI|nr:MFS general substrate transporter [Jaminaea rosea]PWN30299.1 MFS general substrate transporter [Jaminaea rosea]
MPAQSEVDLEKQSSGTTAAHSEAAEEQQERADNVPDLDDEKAGHQKQGTVSSKKSTKFAPFQTPNYNQAGGQAGEGAKVTRTFSRRDPSLHQHDSHIFGGDLQTQNHEDTLTRFQSQAGKDVVTVHWEGEDDPENPKNWGRLYRWYLTGLAGLLVLNSTFTSSAPAGVAPALVQEFGFSTEVAVLTISMFVAGYCLGPLIWGPLSERVGRRPVFLIALLCYTGMNVGCALAPNTAAIIVFRFLAGAFGASPLTNSGGVIADIWDADTRGDAMAIFSIAPFAGPAISPIVSGFIYVTGTDWRWLFWVCTIFSGVCLIITAITLPETYAPAIMQRKAKRIRKETGDERYKAPLDLAKVDASTLLHSIFAKPWIMLAQEPMLLAITLYMAFVYGVLYLLFEAYPIVFEEGHGFNAGVEGLMFLAFFIGGVIAVVIFMTVFNPRYVKLMKAQPKGGRVPPEERLLPVMVAAPALVISLFWFAWTSYPSISYWSPMLAGGLLGLALLFIFVGLFNYIVDAYLMSAASALSGNTVVRSAFGAGFPLFARQMFQKLGTQWAASLLGFIALLMVPIPLLLYKFGSRVRAWSKNAH